MTSSHDDRHHDRIQALGQHADNHGPELPVARQQALRRTVAALTPDGPLQHLSDVLDPLEGIHDREPAPDVDHTPADLPPLMPGAAGQVAAHTPRGSLSRLLEALDGQSNPGPARPSPARPARPDLLARLAAWWTLRPQPVLMGALAMVLAVVALTLVWRSPTPDPRTLYANQPVEELLVVPEQLMPGAALPRGRRLWLGFAGPDVDDTSGPSRRMIRLGIALGAAQVLALSEPGTPPADLARIGALLEALDLPVALPAGSGWSDAAGRRAFLAALREAALDRQLMAELHYGLWLGQLYLYLARSLEEVTDPGNLPGQAENILAAIDPSALTDPERQLLKSIAGMSRTQLSGISPDRRIRQLIDRVRGILDGYRDG